MRSTSRRATVIWLIMIGLLLGIVVISGAVTPQVQLLTSGLYLLMALAALGVLSWDGLRRRLPAWERPSLGFDVGRSRRGRRISTAAQRAQERARHLPGYQERYQLLDVGLIVSEVRPDGLHLRRGDFSLDDQALQPYAVLYVDPTWADDTVTARFEILDPAGETLFICEDRVRLRGGQNNVIASYRLPLHEQAGAMQPGLWELRVAVDGITLGLHTFSVAPSLQERRRMFREGTAAQGKRLREVDDSPVSLEDLLRGHQSGMGGRQHNGE